MGHRHSTPCGPRLILCHPVEMSHTITRVPHARSKFVVGFFAVYFGRKINVRGDKFRTRCEQQLTLPDGDKIVAHAPSNHQVETIEQPDYLMTITICVGGHAV